ncbi:hypothetical protein L915_20725, partial [Phytophthora nicotianae]
VPELTSKTQVREEEEDGEKIDYGTSYADEVKWSTRRRSSSPPDTPRMATIAERSVSFEDDAAYDLDTKEDDEDADDYDDQEEKAAVPKMATPDTPEGAMVRTTRSGGVKSLACNLVDELGEVAGPEPAYPDDDGDDDVSKLPRNTGRDAMKPRGNHPPLNGDTPIANKVLGRCMEMMMTESVWIPMFAPASVKHAGLTSAMSVSYGSCPERLVTVGSGNGFAEVKKETTHGLRSYQLTCAELWERVLREHGERGETMVDGEYDGEILDTSADDTPKPVPADSSRPLSAQTPPTRGVRPGVNERCTDVSIASSSDGTAEDCDKNEPYPMGDSEDPVSVLERTYISVAKVLTTEGSEPTGNGDDDVVEHEPNVVELEDYAQELAFLPDFTEISVTELDYSAPNVQNMALETVQQKSLVDVLKNHERIMISSGNALPQPAYGVVCDIN